jgi:hypothetical protein
MRHNILRSVTLITTSAAFLTIFSTQLRAQQMAAISSSSSAAAIELPDAPVPADSQQPQPQSTSEAQSSSTSTSPQDTNPNPDRGQQTDRILGFVPNFSAVSAGTTLPPQSVKDKFVIAGKNSFDYGTFILTAFQSGIAMAGNSYPEFRQGAVGYGRYYWHTLADTASENFMVGGVGPVIFRQDSRFYTLGHGSIRKRVWYAATRVVVTRTDSGNETFNASEIVGAGAASGISSLYYPEKYRTWTKVGQKWLTSCLIDTANFNLKEFWPDINRKVFHSRF